MSQYFLRATKARVHLKSPTSGRYRTVAIVAKQRLQQLKLISVGTGTQVLLSSDMESSIVADWLSESSHNMSATMTLTQERKENDAPWVDPQINAPLIGTDNIRDEITGSPSVANLNNVLVLSYK